MVKSSTLLIKYGFIKDKFKELYEGCKTPEDYEKRIETFGSAAESHADQETWEEGKNQFLKTEFPAHLKRYRIIWEVYNMSIEEPYFWIINYLRDWGYTNFAKTVDAFAAAENSAFFGVTQQRIGLQQDKVSQFLATIGKMVKELFQLVRELRIIDERLTYYTESYKGVESSEIVLKGIWIDMVEGGTKNPASVYGMAREVQFTSLPDLFFSTHPRTSADVDKVVDTQRAGFNASVRNVLKRKLKTFLEWKDKTFAELKTRRNFTLKYLKQHYDIIRMYMTWVRPYLLNIRRLTLDEEKVLTPELVSAFEGSMVEIEFLAYKLPMDAESQKQNKEIYSVILAHFLYRTRPTMSYQQEGYQRGPLHVGKLEMNFRAYAWTKKQIDNYIKMKEAQDMELMRSISESVKAAMDALGGDLEKYLQEAETAMTPSEGKKPTFLERFTREFFVTKPKVAAAPKPAGLSKIARKEEKDRAKKTATKELFETFKNFKKAHGMIMW